MPSPLSVSRQQDPTACLVFYRICTNPLYLLTPFIQTEPVFTNNGRNSDKNPEQEAEEVWNTSRSNQESRLSALLSDRWFKDCIESTHEGLSDRIQRHLLLPSHTKKFRQAGETALAYLTRACLKPSPLSIFAITARRRCSSTLQFSDANRTRLWRFVDAAFVTRIAMLDPTLRSSIKLCSNTDVQLSAESSITILQPARWVFSFEKGFVFREEGYGRINVSERLKLMMEKIQDDASPTPVYLSEDASSLVDSGLLTASISLEDLGCLSQDRTVLKSLSPSGCKLSSLVRETLDRYPERQDESAFEAKVLTELRDACSDLVNANLVNPHQIPETVLQTFHHEAEVCDSPPDASEDSLMPATALASDASALLAIAQLLRRDAILGPDIRSILREGSKSAAQCLHELLPIWRQYAINREARQPRSTNLCSPHLDDIRNIEFEQARLHSDFLASVLSTEHQEVRLPIATLWSLAERPIPYVSLKLIGGTVFAQSFSDQRAGFHWVVNKILAVPFGVSCRNLLSFVAPSRDVVTARIKKDLNKCFANNVRTVDITDAAGSLGQHVSPCDYYIRGRSDYGSKMYGQPMLLSDIWIRLSTTSYTGVAELFHRRTGEVLYPLSLAVSLSHSPIARFLNYFGGGDCPSLLGMLQSLPPDGTGRIVVGSLCIRRERWNVAQILNTGPTTKDAKARLDLHKVLRGAGVPNNFFYSFNNPLRKNASKRQFASLNSPLLLEMFSRHATRANFEGWIEEALPDPQTETASHTVEAMLDVMAALQ